MTTVGVTDLSQDHNDTKATNNEDKEAQIELQGGPPRARQTLLDNANLCLIRPSTAPTRVNNLKTTDVASVSKAIHTDSQLHPGQFSKVAYTG